MKTFKGKPRSGMSLHDILGSTEEVSGKSVKGLLGDRGQKVLDAKTQEMTRWLTKKRKEDRLEKIKLSEEGTKAVLDALEDTSPPNAKMIEAAVQYSDIINTINVTGEIEAIQLKTNEADSDYAAVCALVNSNLWAKFSEIQCATCISPDAGSMKRFLEWIESGDDDKAWT